MEDVIEDMSLVTVSDVNVTDAVNKDMAQIISIENPARQNR